mmetsp:Transcript_10069/g.26089  ORF Transcript_10069/g.26089 Transcript_10069/m.26089 type:complete len:659 (+) Transcript_10069:16-1992(+)
MAASVSSLANLVSTAVVQLPEHLQRAVAAHAHGQGADAERRALGDVLISTADPIPAEACDAVEALLSAERPKHVDIRPAHAEHNLASWWVHPGAPSTCVGIWRGDITTLRVDAIVNAANEAGMGCFQPSHRCVDNIIHRAAGPRLRASCAVAMRSRRKLPAGAPPILTPGHALPAAHVLHVTGPQMRQGESPTDEEVAQLAACYRGCLEAAKASQGAIRSLAFSCISTGLFAFPSELACEVALRTAREWLSQPGNAGVLDALIFNTYAHKDARLYADLAPLVFASDASLALPDLPPSLGQVAQRGAVARASKIIASADALLVCAGAGMSANDGYNVYVDEADFERHYPDMVRRWGLRTGYECMGLFGMREVPMEAKWGYQARHMHNMSSAWPPSPAYALARELVATTVGESYFVHSSNVDDCFERSGFEASKIYTPQGSWSHFQCLEPCRPDAVWPSRPMLDQVLPRVDAVTGEVPQGEAPACPHCGGPVMGNVRGGDWFIHLYDEAQDRLVEFVEEAMRAGKKVAILEVGAGFNTPTVTRLPMESIARDLGGRGALVRVNPGDASIPGDINGASIHRGWEALADILEGVQVLKARALALGAIQGAPDTSKGSTGVIDDGEDTVWCQPENDALRSHAQQAAHRRGMDWRGCLLYLRSH